jgi:hypothetical protein
MAPVATTSSGATDSIAVQRWMMSNAMRAVGASPWARLLDWTP